MPKKGYKSVPWLFGKEIEIPEEWENVDIGYVADKLLSGGTPSTTIPEYWDGNIPWTKGAVLTTSNTTNGERFISELGLENSSTSIIPKDNLLVVSRVSIGNVSINKINIAINQDITAIILNKTICLTEFLYWNLLQTLRILVSFGQGTTIQGFTRKDLSSHKVLLPPLPEQQQIASILSNVDNLIQNTDKLIEKTIRLKKGLMQELLTRGIGHTKFKKVPWLFGKEIEIPEEWEVRKLKELVVRGNQGINTAIDKVEYVDKGIPILKAGDIKQNLELSSTYNISQKSYDSIPEHHKPKKNDILYSNIGSALGTAMLVTVDTKITIAWNVFRMVIKENQNSKYLTYFLNKYDIWNILKSRSTQSTMPFISKPVLLSLNILLAPLPEQQQIASILSNTDEKIQSYERYKEKLQRLKKSLMQKLLTGEVRVAV